MLLSIRTKLFLTLLLAALLAVVGTHAFVHWSFQQGLESLAAERRQQRIERVAERLLAIYERDGDWETLRTDRWLWMASLFGRIEPDRLEALRPGRHGRGPPWLQQGKGWPPARALEPPAPGDRPPPMELRLMLLDADGNIVFGRPELLPGAEHFPLLHEGKRVGLLALIPGPSITDIADLRFREQQSGHLWIIAVGMVLLSALLALPLSKRLTRPVASFQQTLRRLAKGDYAARVGLGSNDELGQLARDVNALAETLEHNEAARRRWVADISHELRTPLSLLRADVEAMQDGVRPLTAESLGSLHADALRLGRLVDDLYELSMTDLGALSYRKQRLDIAELLDVELDAFRNSFREAGLGLGSRRSDPGPWISEADEQRLSQLYRNLLRNSLRYTDRGGELRVTLSREGGWLVLDFDDSVPCVPEESLPRLFERLYRVEGSRSRATGGAGLGLAIAHNIVDAHGGRITAGPSPLGGLRVQVRLPAASEGAGIA